MFQRLLTHHRMIARSAYDPHENTSSRGAAPALLHSSRTLACRKINLGCCGLRLVHDGLLVCDAVALTTSASCTDCTGDDFEIYLSWSRCYSHAASGSD